MSPSPPTSLTLLGQLRAPAAPAAWAKFDRLYRPLLIGWARKHGFGDADADDLAQEVLLKVARALPTFAPTPGGSFRGWLYAIARTTALDLRRNRATRALPAADGLSGAGAEPPLTEFEERDYRRHVVNRALELVRPELSEQTWAAFRLLMLEGLDAGAVAARLGITPNAVYLVRNRVLTRIRQEIDGLLD